MSETTSHLPPFAIRPRFRVEVPYSPDEITKKIRAKLKTEGAWCRGKSVQGFASFKVHESERHYWSPQLSVMIEEAESGEGSLLRGLYGPAPNVWTMFVFFYSAIGFFLLFVLIIGTSNMSLGEPSTILWWAPVLIVLLLTTYLVSYFGQKLGHDQMETLHTFLEECLGMDIIEQ